MQKTDVIHMRISPELKRESDSVLSRLGMSMSEAVTVFLSQVIFRGGLPFEVRLPAPNKITVAAMHDAENDNNLHRFDSPEAMFEEIGV